MKTITKTLLASICALSFTTTGCAADGFFGAAAAPQSPSGALFNPPPMQQKQPPVEQAVRSSVAVQSPGQLAARASFQLSDTPSDVPAVRSMAMHSATSNPTRLTLAPSGRKTAPTLVTLGPKDDLAAMVRAAPGVVLLDFYADWCGPCRTQGDILHKLQTTAADQNASIIKVNVDQHEAIASVLKVSSLPTLVLIKDGKIVERKTGLADQREVSLMLAR